MAALILITSGAACAWTPSRAVLRLSPVRPSTYIQMFGENCYEGALDPLPENVYEVLIERPLGIGFEELGPVFGKNGVTVSTVVSDSNTDKGTQVMKNVGGTNKAVDGKVVAGDNLVGVTAIQFIGAKWERKMFDCRKWSFDTVVDAIGSNEEKFISDFVILQFERTPAV